ncbi:uncharacterized protein TRIREDRAFT_112147 [Trichoderma reesei QM6a]|uniref:Predicted protein n=2 Tax=Hypocrea jecorina TaxID=51453 RepID=G0RWB6_HYPJQ|nr:uncharacterized protein TRIREDRAFT_112147 [Trichoderma reesei QM6a]EGR44523.1 predicted protein [Trichoderma reesei QM6a]ETR97388.1 hypothetical protein M419DRAFT_91789 [Trichoderma reesei RUT C-30]
MNFSSSNDKLTFVMRPTWMLILESYEREAQGIAVQVVEFSARLAAQIKDSAATSLTSLRTAFGKVHELCSELHGDFDDRGGDTEVVTRIESILSEGVNAFAAAETLAEDSFIQVSQLSQEIRETTDIKIQNLQSAVTEFETIAMPEALEQARAELKHTEDDIEVMTRGVVAVAEAAAKLRRMKRKLENTIPKWADPTGIARQISGIKDKIKDCEREESNLNASIASQTAVLEGYKEQLVALEKAYHDRELGQTRIPELQERIAATSGACEKTYADTVTTKQQAGLCYKKLLECSVQAQNDAGLKKRQLVDYILSLFDMGLFHPAVIEPVRVALLELERDDGPKALLKTEFADRIKEIWKKVDFMILGHDP